MEQQIDIRIKEHGNYQFILYIDREYSRIAHGIIDLKEKLGKILDRRLKREKDNI